MEEVILAMMNATLPRNKGVITFMVGSLFPGWDLLCANYSNIFRSWGMTATTGLQITTAVTSSGVTTGVVSANTTTENTSPTMATTTTASPTSNESDAHRLLVSWIFLCLA